MCSSATHDILPLPPTFLILVLFFSVFSAADNKTVSSDLSESTEKNKTRMRKNRGVHVSSWDLCPRKRERRGIRNDPYKNEISQFAHKY